MKLYYVMDPMCSWCWGFRPVFQQLITSLPGDIEIQYVMGGLAPDSSEPMPQKIRDYIQSQWQAVEAKTGVLFNRDFWDKCHPRRSTYPACRAVIAAGLQDRSKRPGMIHAIQKAYYLQARNPSNIETLSALAKEIQLDSERFTRDISSTDVERLLQEDLSLRQQLGVTSFPSLRLRQAEQIRTIELDYIDAQKVIDQIISHIP